MQKRALLLITLGMLGACSQIPGEAYYNRGAPESLMDNSSEVVNIQLESDASVNELSQWVNQDQPTRAEVYCMEGDPVCRQARDTLDQFGVQTMYVAASDNNIALVYERVMARDCENRYIDNSINPYNLNHPTFGCSLAANMVQMVSDKRQFTNPDLLDYADSEKTQQVYNAYAKPKELTKTLKIEEEYKPIVTRETLN